MTTSEALAGMNAAGTAQGAKSASSVSRSKASGSVDFGSIMSQSLATRADSKDKALYTNVSSAASSKDVRNIKGTDRTDRQETAVQQPDDGYAAGDIQEVQQPDTETIDADKLENMLEDIKEKIKDTLGITKEEFEAVLAQLGLSIQDLLNVSNLTEFVVQVKGTDGALSLITDGDLSEQLKGIMDFINGQVEQLAGEMNMTPQEVKDRVLDMTGQKNFADALENVPVQAETEEAGEAVRQDIQPVQTQPEDMAGTTEKPETLESKITVQTQPEGGNAQSSDMQQKEGGMPQEHAAGPVADIAVNLAQSINDAFGEVTVQNMQHTDAADIVQQIIDSVRVTATENLQSMEIQLNPENLGKVYLTVTSKDGILTAQLTTQDEAVKKAIESQLAILKDNFNNQGLKVQNVEVTVESHAYDQNRDLAGNGQNQETNQNRRRHLNLDSLMGLDEEDLTDEEQHAMEMLKSEGSSVSYTA